MFMLSFMDVHPPTQSYQDFCSSVTLALQKCADVVDVTVALTKCQREMLAISRFPHCTLLSESGRILPVWSSLSEWNGMHRHSR